MPTVFANGRSILHKGDGLTHVAAPPDVCKVPTPGGPVPTPFVNTASDSMLARGSKATKIAGNPVALADSEISTSSGDEPGTAGGLISSKFKGKLTWSGASTDVKAEGKGVVRFMDPTAHNGNSFNTAFISDGGTGLAFGDDALCPLTSCGKPVEQHRVHETTITVQLLGELQRQLDAILDAPIPALAEAAAIRSLVASDLQLGVWLRTNLASELTQRSVVRAIVELGAIAFLGSVTHDRTSTIQKLLDQLKLAVDACKGRHVLKGLPLSRFSLFHDKLDLFAEWKAAEATTGAAEFSVPLAGFTLGASSCVNCGKRFITHSGTFSSNGVKEAYSKLGGGIEFVEPKENKFADNPRYNGATGGKAWRDGWTCAASHLLEHMRKRGHAPRSLSERWYSPLQYLEKAMRSKTPNTAAISGRDTGLNATNLPKVSIGGDEAQVGPLHRAFKEVLASRGPGAHAVAVKHGESMSSCEKCQQFLPGLLCPPPPDDCT